MSRAVESRRTPPPWTRVVLLALAVLATGAFATRARAETPIPDAPSRWVTDAAGFLSAAQTTSLDARLGRYAQDTGHQVLVYIDRTTGGVPIEDWAVRAFQRWKVGRHGIDDGLVLFVFGDDRSLRIEVGYGLEDRVPDVIAARIINERMVPRIRAGDRDGALQAGVDTLLATIGGEHDAPPGADARLAERAPLPSGIPAWQIILGVVGMFLFFLFASRHPMIAALMMTNIGSGRGGGWGGGGGGGGGGFSGGGGSSGGGGASGSW